MLTLERNIRLGKASFFVMMALLTGGCSQSPRTVRDHALTAGRKWLEKGDYKRAILEFKTAEQAMPRDAESQCQLGNAYAAMGAPIQAVAAYRKAIELNPNHAEAGRKLAAMMAVFGDRLLVEQAEKRLHALLDASPADVAALNALAYAELRLGESEPAVRRLEQALAKSPKELGSAVLLAEAKLAGRDAAGAEEILKRTAAQNPNSADIQIILGRFYNRLGRRAEAEQRFEQALKIQPKNAPALFYLGMLNNADGRKQAAEQKFKFLSRQPDSAYWPFYAIYLFQEGRTDEAIHEFERLYQQDKEDRAARTRLISAYLAAGRPDDAEELVSAALKRNSKDVDALLQRGELRLRRGKYSDAQMDLNVVLHENPNLPEAHFLQSRIYEKSGATLTERQQLNETLRLNPLFLPARLALAHVLTSANAFKNAMELLDETPPEQKASLAILVERNWVYAAMGDWKRCQQGITQGLAIQRTSDLLIQEALSKFEHKDFAGAEASAREALHQAPGDVRALEALGLSYLGREEVVAAKAKLQEYVSQQPQSAAVQLFWGKWLLAVGDTNAARAALSAARTANGDTTEVDLNLARADLGDRNWNSARQTLQAILAHNGENVTARYWLAQVEEIQGNHHASEEQYRKVIAADPANVKALNNLAYLLAETAAGASDALSFAQRAKALAPEDPAVADTLGWAFYRNGLYRLAIRELKQVNMVQSTARRASHLSMAYFKAGDENRAQEALARARKMDPSDPEVMQAERLIAGKAMTKAELKESGQFPKSFPRVLEFQNHRM